jgi:hypothetical protein
MEKQNDSMRDRLLARMPQPKNLAAYREETAALLAKHEKALFWQKWTGALILLIGIIAMDLSASRWARNFGQPVVYRLWIIGGSASLLAALDGLARFIYRNQVNLLKEVKQVQLQILELQASQNKRDGIQ